uniref:NADP-dependent oxidoreductase domain-containing protein n=1 Tax=Pseudo-nitzschia australis TaxID=44445 RepID=A0A7S4AC27_9STRA
MSGKVGVIVPLRVLILSLLCSPIRSFAVRSSAAFLMKTSPESNPGCASSNFSTNPRRRQLLQVGAGSLFSGLPFFGSDDNKAKAAAPSDQKKKAGGPTGEVVKIVKGMKHKRLGNSDIFVSDLGLGTQRWVSTDFNAPDRELCYEFMDEAILKRGVNLIDTAEQYPIPAGGRASEGDTERVIGNWMKDRNVPRIDVVIATKITGGTNITPRNIKKDCEESLKRLQTDYVDVYLCHWPQRYSPQSNWGQSLSYDLGYEASYRKSLGNPTSFEDLCQSMEGLIQAGKIRGWGLCNDNAYGLTACTRTAKALGTTPPCTMQGDFSILDRKSEENGVAEAASPYNENVGFMAYNTLAGGMLTGKYMDVPSAFDDTNRDRAMASLSKPRGRMDTRGWGGTLIRYRTEAAQDAIREYNKIAKANKMSLTELSLRWCKQRDLITTTLLGHTNMNQLKETLVSILRCSYYQSNCCCFFVTTLICTHYAPGYFEHKGRFTSGYYVGDR